MSPAATSPQSGQITAANLQQAYDLSSEIGTDGAGTTVAIVDAYQDPNIVSDLAAYRSENGLGACNTTTGAGCLSVYNETGGTSLSDVPVDTTGGWEFEQSIDVDMVSAICPLCHIALYEANSTGINDLGTADNTAAASYKFVSNSWGNQESPLDFPGESSYDDQYFNHPGVVLDFSAGDFGYEPAYPASSQLVTSVGGTYLAPSSSGTGWTQSVWNDGVNTGVGTASGCSSGEGKPSWETDTAAADCPNRTSNDVAAAAQGPDGISIYDSYNPTASGDGNTVCGGWCSAQGTSVASPIVTAAYALAIGGTTAAAPTPNTYPVQYLYQNDGAGLIRVTSGSNAYTYEGADHTCESDREYLCNAADSLPDGYNGPTGWGTPNGANLSAFTNTSTKNVLSLINPGTYDLQTGVGYTLPVMQATDDGTDQTLTYSANKLPSGMSIDSSNGQISGVPSAAGTTTITVTATDTSGVTASVTFDIVATGSLDTNFHPVTGPVPLAIDGKCMDDTNNSSTNGNKVQIWGCSGGVNQKWAYVPDTNPGGAGILVHNDKCLAVSGGGTTNGTKVELWTCNGTGSQQWWLNGYQGEVVNPASGLCLDDPSSSTTNGTQLDIETCSGDHNQAWTMPASPIQSGITGMCAADRNGSNANGNYIWLWSCGGQSSQDWTLSRTGTLLIEGKCLGVGGRATTNGSPTVLWSCGSVDQYWAITGTGEIENDSAQKCLAASGTGDGARLELEDCVGTPNEIWAQS
jgi:hypothetical protein